MVKENMNTSGLGAIRTGAIDIYRELVNDKNKGDAKFEYNTISNPVKVTITGKAVFEDFELREVPRKIVFICNTDSCYTILSDLKGSDIYLRIKNFFNDMLDNCLGKSPKEQHDYLFRFNRPNSISPKLPGLIEDCEEYIRSLPDNPSKEVLEKLIKSKIWDPFGDAFDENGVAMHQYKNALKKKL